MVEGEPAPGVKLPLRVELQTRIEEIRDHCRFEWDSSPGLWLKLRDGPHEGLRMLVECLLTCTKP